MPKLPSLGRRSAVAAGLTAALVGAGGVAYAATPSSPSAPAPAVHARAGGARAGAARAGALKAMMIGEVSSVTDTASGRSLSLTAPDGAAFTVTLGPRARVWRYQGPGHKPTAETPSQLAPGEIVVVHVVRGGAKTSNQSGAGTLRANLVLDTGFSGPAGT